MPTVAREIDALGGAGTGDYCFGYSAALADAQDIAENADALIEELIECIANALSGGVGLEHWVKDARMLVQRASWRRAR